MRSASARSGAIGFWQMTGMRWAAASSTKRRVRRGVGDDVDEVDVLPPQQLLRVVVDGADAELPRQRLGLGARAVVEGHALAPPAARARRRAGSAPRSRFRARRIEAASSWGTRGVSGSGATLSATPGGCPWSTASASAPPLRAMIPARARPALAGDTASDDPGGPSMHRFALALVLAMSAAGPTAANDAAKAPAPEDRYLWLEEVPGEKALAWARARNAESAEGAGATARLRRAREAAPRHPRLARSASPTSRSSGAGTTTSGATRSNPRGLWRRTTLGRVPQGAARPGRRCSTSTRSGAAEKENWVWHGADCLKPRLPALPRPALARRRRRHRGARVRPRGQGLRDRRLHPARGQEPTSAWLDADTLYVGTDFGPGSLTDSGYPRIVQALEARHAAGGGRDGVRGPGRRTCRSAPAATTPRASSATSCCAA